MPVFIRNFNLSHLTEQGSLRDSSMLDFTGKARWRDAHGAYYLDHSLASGVTFIFHTVRDGDTIEVVATDTHYASSCIWTAWPFMNITAKHADPLSACLAFTNETQDGVFTAHLVHAAVLERIEENAPISLQIVAFPASIAVYDDRNAYEEQARRRFDAQPSDEPLVLSDKAVFPLNFMINHDPERESDAGSQSLRDDIILACGPVLEMSSRDTCDDEGVAKPFLVARIGTMFGNLDVVFTQEMIADSVCNAGSYLVFSGILSADVAIGEKDVFLD